MSRDIAVYVKRATTIPPEDVLVQMRLRGIPVEWKHMAPLKFTASTNWTRGYFFLEGVADPRRKIDISAEKIKDYVREYLLDEQANKPYHEFLRSAQVLYVLSVVFSADTERDRAFICLADIIAEIGDGLISDSQTKQFYSLAEYRRQYASVLGQRPLQGK